VPPFFFISLWSVIHHILIGQIEVGRRNHFPKSLLFRIYCVSWLLVVK
jgi:hypothetical protein